MAREDENRSPLRLGIVGADQRELGAAVMQPQRIEDVFWKAMPLAGTGSSSLKSKTFSDSRPA